MRKLASIRTISDISPIENADAIEVATVDGWKVVTKKGEFKVGDRCVYIEIDSFLPEGNPAWQFLVDKSGINYNGKRGHRLRTVKLRGQLSQGFLVSLNKLSDVIVNIDGEQKRFCDIDWSIEDDVTEFLGIEKWEQPIPASLAGQVEGAFPSFISKTDQERCQNLVHEIFHENKDCKYEITIKLDGTSCTIYHFNGKVGVCSRNYELKINEENIKSGNSYVKIAIDSGLLDHLPKLGNYAIQGELMGPGIQKNREKLNSHKLFIFDIFDIDNHRYLTPSERYEFFNKLMELTNNGNGIVDHVPILRFNVSHEQVAFKSLQDLGINNIDDLLEFSNGPSLNNKTREGLVFKSEDAKFSFKVISNNFLLKEES